jgi:enoyl-CoA hydratase
MMADFIMAGDNAKFGQPEIKLAVTPGMGGSQRLTRAIGKAKAMEMCLTGRMMDAAEAERSGLVARIVPATELVEEAIKTAMVIAAMAPLAPCLPGRPWSPTRSPPSRPTASRR